MGVQALVAIATSFWSVLDDEELTWRDITVVTGRLLRGVGIELLWLQTPEGHRVGPAGSPAPDLVRGIELDVTAGGGGVRPLEVDGYEWSALVAPGPGAPALMVASQVAPDADQVCWVQLLALGCGLAGEAVQRRAELALSRATGEVAELVQGDGGYEGIADLLHRRLGHPVAIYAPGGQVLAAAPDRASNVPLRRLVGAGARRAGRWWLTIAQDGGAVVAVGVGEADLGPNERTLVWSASLAATLELHRVGVPLLPVDRDTALALWDVLFGRDRDEVARRARKLDYPVDRPHLAVVVDVTHAEADRVHDAVRSALTDRDLGRVVIDDHGQVVAAVWREPTWDGLLLALRDQVGPCRVGVGAWRASIAELPASVREARIAAKLRDALGGPAVARYDGLGVLGLLTEGDPQDLVVLVDTWIGVVIDYDRGHRTELVRTLAAYLENGGSVDQAAAELHVHRSTLKYRLGRIRDLTGRDLTDAGVRFNMQVATRARAALDALGGADHPLAG